jgi:hypothetical protein
MDGGHGASVFAHPTISLHATKKTHSSGDDGRRGLPGLTLSLTNFYRNF